MRCTKCNYDNPADALFCMKCGTKVENRCSSCNTVNPADANFCRKCGGALGAGVPVSSPSPRAALEAPRVEVTHERQTAEGLEGERKTVTALFADIKGSTEMMEDLDPEEARAIIDPALKLMIDAAHRYDGYVVQSTGDGIFALFGAPVAHEDHPQRALYAALRMQEELKRYSARLREVGNLPIEGRVGVNTGEVVVRSISTGAGHTEYTPIGHTTNLASRIQALAPTGSIAISEQTRKLVEGYFALKPLGPTKVKGVTEPVNVYEATGLGPLRTRLQRSAGRGLTKFVGREHEMVAMRAAAEQAHAGHGQIVAAMAEAGTGKSRLFFEFKAKNQSGWMVLETFSVSHGKASAYFPVIDLLHNYFKIIGDDDERSRRAKVIGSVLALDRALEDALPYLVALLGIVEGDDPLAQMDGQVKKRRTLDAIKRLLLRESLNQPLMVFFEDLHWIDDETQAFLNLLADSIGTARLLLLVNYRPEYSHHWNSKTYYTQLRLDPLGKEGADEMLSAIVGDGADVRPLKRLIIERTQGNPFFMEETVQVLLDEGALKRDGAIVRLTKPLNELKIPPTVQAILAARIDRLPADEKDLLQALAVIGKEFQLSLVRAVTAKSDDELNRMLADLQLAEFIYEQPATGDIEYIFKHALTQEVAYNSMLIERRKLLHDRIGSTLESLHAQDLQDHLLDVAHHYSRSSNTAKAIHYLGLAARESLKRSSLQQAADLADRGLKLIARLPEDTRNSAELSLVLSLIAALVGAKGYSDPELGLVLTRGLDLCAEIGNARQLFLVLNGLMYYHAWRAEWTQNRQILERMLALANKEKSSEMLAETHIGLMDSTCLTGQLTESQAHAIAVSDLAAAPDQHNDFDRVLWNGRARWCEAYVLWYVGYPDRAKRSAFEALEVFRSYGDARQLAQLLNNCHPVFALSGDIGNARRFVDEAITVAERYGLRTQVAWATFNLGCTLVLEGNLERGISTMIAGMTAHEEAGNRIKTWMLGPLTNAYRLLGSVNEGFETAERAFKLAEESGERLWLSEIHRLYGELILLDRGASSEAERRFRIAISIAREQQAKSWELRATISLARLLENQKELGDAGVMLREIYSWFSEGFGNHDLQEAKSRLDRLAG